MTPRSVVLDIRQARDIVSAQAPVQPWLRRVPRSDWHGMEAVALPLHHVASHAAIIASSTQVSIVTCYGDRCILAFLSATNTRFVMDPMGLETRHERQAIADCLGQMVRVNLLALI